MKKYISILIFGLTAFCSQDEQKRDSYGVSEKSKVESPDQLFISGTVELADSNSLSTDALERLDIFCKAIDEPSQTCSITILADQTFNSNCSKLIGHSVGCYLREDSLAHSQLLANHQEIIPVGGGHLKLELTLSEDFASLSGPISSGSTATESNSLAKALLDQSTKTEWSENIPGNWQTICVSPDSLLSGQAECESQSYYIANEPTETGDFAQFSIWESETCHSACYDPNSLDDPNYIDPNDYLADPNSENIDPNDLTDANTLMSDVHVTPMNLNIKVGNTIVPLSLEKISYFEQGLDYVIELLPADLQKTLSQLATTIEARGQSLKAQMDLIRDQNPQSFKELPYEVPDETTLTRQLFLTLLQTQKNKFNDVEFCTTYLADESFEHQVTRLYSLQLEIICQFDLESKTESYSTTINDIKQQSCIPKTFFDYVYNASIAKTELLLRCPSSESPFGTCYNENLVYIGGIEGRLGSLKQQNHYNDVFELSFQNSMNLTVVHPLSGLKTCNIYEQASLKGLKQSDHLFLADFTHHFVDSCSNHGASQNIRQFGELQNNFLKNTAQIWQSSFTRTD